MKPEFKDMQDAFDEESSELLDAMEEALLHIQDNGMDDDTINSIFRAVHTIKGAAGMFDVGFLASFTHIAENLLDEIRAHRIELTDPILEVFFKVKDHMTNLVDYSLEDETGELNEELTEISDILLEHLNYYLNGGEGEYGSSDNSDESVQDTPKEVVQNDDIEQLVEDNTPEIIEENKTDDASIQKTKTSNGSFCEYKIKLKFEDNSLDDGIEPTDFIENLSFFGDIENLNSDLINLEFNMNYKTQKDKDIINNIFNDIKDYCAMDIEPIKKESPQSTPQEIEVIKKCNDLVETLKENIPSIDELAKKIEEKKEEPIDIDQKVQASDENIQKADFSNDEKKPCQTVQTIEPTEDISNKELKSIEKPSFDDKKENKPASPTPAKKTAKKLPKEKETGAKISSTVKVDSVKIDTLINLIGEMVIANSNVVSKAETLNNKAMTETVSSVSRMVEELREAAMNMRMVPIGETFGRFKRIVRDLARELNKEIELTLIGSETELDKTVVDKIVDPLIHLVRNSVDHGIETKEDRLEKDKPIAGNITLKAFHEAGFIAIQIIDDGKGLDPEFLKQKAIDKGLISEHDILTDKECYELILAAGFSTAEKITNISGRGVGMDVVRRNIEDLKGSISIDSQKDVGTTITVKLPLTLAIIDGFLTKVGEKSYIIPLNMIVECIQLSKDYKEQLKENDYINLRGGILSLLDLRDFFDIPKIGSKRENIVIVKFDGKSIGLIVDELKGEFQTVIKPLGKIFQNIKGLGGSTILGGGEVGMILDVPLLIKSVTETVN